MLTEHQKIERLTAELRQLIGPLQEHSRLLTQMIEGLQSAVVAAHELQRKRQFHDRVERTTWRLMEELDQRKEEALLGAVSEEASR